MNEISKDSEIESGQRYLLTMNQLVTLCRDFMVDCHDGFVSNDEAWIEHKIKDWK